MLKIDKQVVLTIDGDDLHVLSTICEMASVRIAETAPGGGTTIPGCDAQYSRKVRDFISEVFHI